MKNIDHALSVSVNEEELKVGIATTPEEKREIYRLRYSIYAEEIGYNLVSVDHQNRLLYDELDEWGLLLYAQAGSTIVGTARINIGRLEDFPSNVVQPFRMDQFSKFYNEMDNPYFAVISKGAISAPYRGSLVLNLIMAKLYDLYCNYQVQFAFVNCKFHLISLQEHFGSIRIDKNILDPSGGGPLASFVMLVDDIQHLQIIGSPLFDIACKRMSFNTKVSEWFYSEFSHETKSTVNSQLVTRDELWAIIYQYLGSLPTHSIPILKGLSVPEAKLFLHSCSSIVHCRTGDYITVDGITSQELIILLSGTAQSSLHNTILPGQYCGENGLVHRTIHSTSIIAVEDTNILVLSFHFFGKFRKNHPEIAYKILNNLHFKSLQTNK